MLPDATDMIDDVPPEMSCARRLDSDEHRTYEHIAHFQHAKTATRTHAEIA